MNIDIIFEKIHKYNLPIDHTIIEVIDKYNDIYGKEFSNLALLLLYIRNILGEELIKIDEDIAEFLGWLKLNTKEYTYFHFEDEEDYFAWKSNRDVLYENLINNKNSNTLRLLNYLELNIINNIQDNSTKYKAFKKDSIIECDNINMHEYFKQGYLLLPIKN
jgi:hypothetical protein